jgi:hypothetical protein
MAKVSYILCISIEPDNLDFEFKLLDKMQEQSADEVIPVNFNQGAKVNLDTRRVLGLNGNAALPAGFANICSLDLGQVVNLVIELL